MFCATWVSFAPVEDPSLELGHRAEVLRGRRARRGLATGGGGLAGGHGLLRAGEERMRRERHPWRCMRWGKAVGSCSVFLR